MSSGVFWTKIVFCIVCWCEAFFAGIFPTLSKGCRENPKILGIANAFASGVFLAIALIHILPEEVDIYYNELHADDNWGDLFPVPFFLMWAGYTLILVIDKVMFDTSKLFVQGEDPVERKLSQDMAKALNSTENTGSEMQKAVESYNNPYDKFATRMADQQEVSAYPTLDDGSPVNQARINPSEMTSEMDVADAEKQLLGDEEKIQEKPVEKKK
jgi:hypothetical protein